VERYFGCQIKRFFSIFGGEAKFSGMEGSQHSFFFRDAGA
jgi:hypothetical protein